MIEDILNKKVIDFKFSKTEFLKLINNIKTSIKENKKLINNSYEIDKLYYEGQVKQEDILAILDSYKEEEINNEKNIENIWIEYRGNPYTTIKLCIEAILHKKKIMINPNDFMLGVNMILVEIINKELNRYGIKDLISLCNLVSYEEIKNNDTQFSKIIVIDLPEVFDELQSLTINNLEEKFENYINLYCADDDLVELRDMLCDFANANHIALEIWDDCFQEEAADTLENYAIGNIVILLSNKIKLQEEFKNKIKTKRLFINKNTFVRESEILGIFKDK